MREGGKEGGRKAARERESVCVCKGEREQEGERKREKIGYDKLDFVAILGTKE